MLIFNYEGNIKQKIIATIVNGSLIVKNIIEKCLMKIKYVIKKNIYFVDKLNDVSKNCYEI